ncbi:hypothetical protein, partial [Sinomonas gamaensis]|uniref:hypothetical protein n=1 Tax=Sinomonas gamaensis TaxID=2565624 RepID=UPI001BB21593
HGGAADQTKSAIKKMASNRTWHTIEFSNNRSPRNISQNHLTRSEATSLTYQIIASASNSFSQFKATAIYFRPSHSGTQHRCVSEL